MTSVDRRDEYRHDDLVDDGPEAWLFDLVQADASLALSIEMVIWPAQKRFAFHFSVVRPGQELVSLVELHGRAPNPPSLEVRASGLWTDIGIQTPLDHATVDVEAFAVQLEDTEDVFRGAYGHRTALGCELEWDTDGTPVAGPSGTSYEIPCLVHGELLLADDAIEIDGWGWRSHHWGQPAGVRTRARGRSADGTWWRSDEPDRELTMAVLGEAPVLDPLTDAPLRQFLARSEHGDRSIAWIRRND